MPRLGIGFSLYPVRSLVVGHRIRPGLRCYQFSRCYAANERPSNKIDGHDVFKMGDLHMDDSEVELIDELIEDDIDRPGFVPEEEELAEVEHEDFKSSDDDDGTGVDYKRRVVNYMTTNRKSNQYQKVIDLYENLPIELSEEPEVYYEAIRAYLALGKEREALETFELAKSKDMSNADMYNTYLYHLTSRQSYYRAEVVLREMLDQGKFSIFSYMLQIEMAYFSGNADAVVSMYKRVMAVPRVFNHKFAYRVLTSTIQYYSWMRIRGRESGAMRVMWVVDHFYECLLGQFMVKEFSQIHDRVMVGMVVQVKKRLMKEILAMQRRHLDVNGPTNGFLESADLELDSEFHADVFDAYEFAESWDNKLTDLVGIGGQEMKTESTTDLVEIRGQEMKTEPTTDFEKEQQCEKEICINEDGEYLMEAERKIEIFDDEEEDLMAIIGRGEEEGLSFMEDDMEPEEIEELVDEVREDELMEALDDGGDYEIPDSVSWAKVHRGSNNEASNANDKGFKSESLKRAEYIDELCEEMEMACRKYLKSKGVDWKIPDGVYLPNKPTMAYSGQSGYSFDLDDAIKPCSKDHARLIWHKDFTYYKDMVLENGLIKNDYALRCIVVRDAFYGKYDCILVSRALKSILERYQEMGKDTVDLEEQVFRTVVGYFSGLIFGFHNEMYKSFMEFIMEVNDTTLEIEMEPLIQKCILRCIKTNNLSLLPFTFSMYKKIGLESSSIVEIKPLLQLFIECDEECLVFKLLELFKTSFIFRKKFKGEIEKGVEYSIDFEIFDMMLKYFVDKGDVEKAIRFFESYCEEFREMIVPEYEQWMLMAYHARLGWWKEVMAKYEELVDTGHFPNSLIAHQVILAHHIGTRYSNLLRIYEEMRENKVFFEETTNSIVYRVFLAKKDDDGLMNNYLERKNCINNPATVHTLNALLKVKNSLKKYQETLQIFKSEFNWDYIIRMFDQRFEKNPLTTEMHSSEDHTIMPNEDSITELIIAAGNMKMYDLILDAWKIGFALELQPTIAQCLHSIYFSDNIPLSLHKFYTVIESILPYRRVSNSDLEIYEKIQHKLVQFVNYNTLSLLSLISGPNDSHELNEKQKQIFLKILRLLCLDLQTNLNLGPQEHLKTHLPFEPLTPGEIQLVNATKLH